MKDVIGAVRIRCLVALAEGGRSVSFRGRWRVRTISDSSWFVLEAVVKGKGVYEAFVS